MKTLHLNKEDYDKSLSFHYGDLEAFKVHLIELISKYKSIRTKTPKTIERIRMHELFLRVTQQRIYADLTDVRFEGKGVDRYISYAEDANGKELSEDQLNDIPSDIIDEYWNA